MQEAQVDIIPLAVCNSHDWYGGKIKDDMLCAGTESGGIDSCQVSRDALFYCNACYYVDVISNGDINCVVYQTGEHYSSQEQCAHNCGYSIVHILDLRSNQSRITQFRVQEKAVFSSDSL